RCYRDWSSDVCSSDLWLKPASAARLYANGRQVAQVIRLRDGRGWSIRVIDRPKGGVARDEGQTTEIGELVKSLIQSRGLASALEIGRASCRGRGCVWT